ncbi:MAG TPA: bifunctional methionine sulfoxide reductase B/A protein [Candidatus Hydrogenedentes bacterium]|nr:bifunctional methionine sulfoxide reductase B/A protein [Candidatus Hydrogenedentota bacterium]
MTKNIKGLTSALIVAAVVVAGIAGIRASDRVHGEELPSVPTETSEKSAMVTVRVIDKEGKLTGPVSVPRVEKSEEDWKSMLSPAQFAVVRAKGTERPFCGTLLDNKKTGYYVCVACKLPLFHSGAKFDSGTGWPSFFQPVAKENILEERDVSHGMVRTEIMCMRCEGHLGHVFEDGPKPTGLRFCLNSESLTFVEEADAKSVGEEVPTAALAASTEKTEVPKAVTRLPLPANDFPKADAPGESKAVFGGGCFWCTEAIFEDLPGVKKVLSGYAGGDAASANYDAVSSGTTEHAEVIEITYDPSQLTYGELLRIFMGTHNPTQLNAQGPDKGKQYRSAVFYADEKQKAIADEYFKALNETKLFGGKPIVTTLEPLKAFYPAEEYHQDFAKTNPKYPYVQYWLPEKMKKRDELLGIQK